MKEKEKPKQMIDTNVQNRVNEGRTQFPNDRNARTKPLPQQQQYQAQPRPAYNPNYKGYSSNDPPRLNNWQKERLKKIEREMNAQKKKMCVAFFKTSDERPKVWNLGLLTDRNEGIAWSRAFQMVPSNGTGQFPHGYITFEDVPPVPKAEKPVAEAIPSPPLKN
jgi:hypothetical protein